MPTFEKTIATTIAVMMYSMALCFKRLDYIELIAHFGGLTVSESLNDNFLFFIAGNVQHYEIIDCLKHDLIPTVVDKEAILEMSNAIKSTENKCYENGESQVGLVDIKVDTGMSRNGCQAHELQGLITVRELWHKNRRRNELREI